MSEAERRPGIFAARPRFWMLSGFVAGLLLAVLAVLFFTQTRWGHERVLALTLRAVSGQLDGTLTVERLDGNLLTGARLYGVTLRGPGEQPFFRADSVFVAYNLRTLAADEIVLDRLEVFHGNVLLRQMPGDTLWNFDRIFGDTVPPADRDLPASPRRPLVVRAGGLVGTTVVIELPWEPDPELAPAEQRREAREALADTSQIIVREVPGGYLRTIRLLDATADLERLVSAPDELGGTSLRVSRFEGGVQFFRQPFPVRRMEGDVSYQDNVLRFDAPAIVLPASQLAAHGVIELGREEGPRYDVTVRGDTVAFADLQPLYQRLPDEGGGALELLIETRPEGTLFLARGLRLSAPGTTVSGSFGMIINDVVRFVEVDLAAEPLRAATIEAMLPAELPVVGLRIGAVEIRQGTG